MGIIAKQSIQGTIATYVGVAVGFVTTFFVSTRFLAPEDIGLVRVMIDAATLFISLAQLGTSASIIRFYPYFRTADDTPNDEHGFFFWTMLVPLFGFIGIGALFIACHEPLSAWFGEKSPAFVHYYYFVLPLAFAMLYQAVFETNANVRMHIVVPRIVRELFTRLGLLACYLLYAFNLLTTDGFLIGIIVVYVLAAMLNGIYLFSLGNISLKPDLGFLRRHPDMVHKYLRYTGFLIISAVTSALVPTLSSFFVTAQMGLEYTGIYSIATYIAIMVSIPYRSVGAIASPQLAASLKDNQREQTTRLVQQVSTTLMIIGEAILLIIWVNIDLIFHLLPNGSIYAAGRNVVLFLGISQLITATFQVTVTTLNYSRFYAISLLLSFLLTAVSLYLNNRLIPIWGMDGAAIATLASQALYSLLTIAVVRFVPGISVVSRQWWMALGIFVAVMVLNMLCLRFLPISNIWFSSIVRSAVLLLPAAWLIYRLELSPEINHEILHRLRLPRH